jgi:hypothetical protein
VVVERTRVRVRPWRPMSDSADHAAAALLGGSADLHLHFGPDAHLARSVDALEAAEQAAAAGMAAIVLKSHDYPTAPLATIVDKAVPGVRVFGGLTLDRQVGGLNPSTVEVSARLGAKIVWLPTLSSANDHAKLGFPGPGISILEGSALRPEMHEIFALARSHDLVLASGHVSVVEIDAFLKGAREAGVEKLLITHALETLAGPTLTFDDLHRFIAAGAMIEFSYLTCGGALATEPPEKIAGAIRAVGAEHCVMSTDYGQKKNVPPVEGMRLFIRDMLRCGIEERDVERMVRGNPAALLGGV